VLMLAGVTPSLVGRALRYVEEGLALAGRSRSEIEVCLGAVCHVANDDIDVVRVARPHCVGDAQRGALPAFAEVGVQLRSTVPAHIPGVYPDITHAEDWDLAATAASQWVDDISAQRYAQAFTLIGTPDELAGRLQAAMAAGVDSFYLRHYRSYVLPFDLLDRFADVAALGVRERPNR
jgi:5,10-methylenetetrahydromethanopterin reductase